MRLLMKVINPTGLYVRSLPSTSGEILNTLPLNTEIIGVEVANADGGSWYRIENTKSWVCGEFKDGSIRLKILANLETTSLPITVTPTILTESTSTTPIKINTDGDARVSLGLSQDIISLLETEGTRVKSKNKIDGATRLFGIPHQFTEKIDLRNNNQLLDIGRKYMETIIAEAPIVTIIPGRPNYLPDVNKNEKDAISSLFTSTKDTKQTQDLLSEIVGNDDIRYFGFISDYYTYMRYVNLLCSITALMMGLGDNYGFLNGKDIVPYYKFDWTQYKFIKSMEYKTKDGVFTNNKVDEKTLFDNFIGELVGTKPNYVQFYVEPNSSFSENASNSTTASKIEGLFDTAEGFAKEFSFLTNTGAMKGLDQTRENFSKTMQDIADKFSNTDNFVKRALGLGSQVLSGANIAFPEIWSDANYNKSYTVTVNLVSPYGTKEALYLNIFVPLMHLIALGLPRQTSANTYSAPFLIKAFAKGWFNCEMGVVDSISIDKANSGETWTVDGFPSEVKVTLSIKDLYTNLAITKETEVRRFFQNQSLMEFLASICGVDLTKPELQLKVDLIRSLVFGYFTELDKRLYEEVITSLKNNFFQYWQDLTRFTKF